ncbi:MAG: hypothetical protein KW802_04420 [Candidatus Doudnabacteria bacterium]|nr:hypothetical protein [Candidatus Doudnabacteria bacterium]
MDSEKQPCYERVEFDILAAALLNVYRNTLRPRIMYEADFALRAADIEKIRGILESPELLRIIPRTIGEILDDLRALEPTPEQIAASRI